MKPCPFCGGKAQMTFFEKGFDYHEAHISCVKCGAKIEKRVENLLVERFDPLKQKRVLVNSGVRRDMNAMELWNRRVSDGNI